MDLLFFMVLVFFVCILAIALVGAFGFWNCVILAALLYAARKLDRHIRLTNKELKK